MEDSDNATVLKGNDSLTVYLCVSGFFIEQGAVEENTHFFQIQNKSYVFVAGRCKKAGVYCWKEQGSLEFMTSI